MFKFNNTHLKNVHTVEVYPDGIVFYASWYIKISKEAEKRIEVVRVFHDSTFLNATLYTHKKDERYEDIFTSETTREEVNKVTFHSTGYIRYGVECIYLAVNNRTSLHMSKYPELETVDLVVYDANNVLHQYRSSAIDKTHFTVEFATIANPVNDFLAPLGEGSVDQAHVANADAVEHYYHNEKGKWELR